MSEERGLRPTGAPPPGRDEGIHAPAAWHARSASLSKVAK